MKEKKIQIGSNRAYGLLMGLIGVLCLLCGCSKDESSTGNLNGEPEGTVLGEVASYVTGFDEANGANKANGARRAWAIPGGYEAYGDGAQPIGIAFTVNGEEPKIGSFFKSGDKWRTSIEDIDAKTYYLYGYIPNITGITFEVNGANGTHEAYSDGAIMTLKNVSSVMPNDLCVVIGAKDGTGKETVSGLRMGDFGYTASASSEGNYVFLLFDHLYAALRIRMRVHDDYNKLRTIKLKSLQLSTQAGETTTKQKTTITVTLSSTDGGSPINGVTFTPQGEALDDGLEFWSSTAGEALTTEFQPFLGYFMPLSITSLSLTSIYDVYDKKGNLLRKDCKVTNRMVLNDLFSGQTVALRGRRYTVNMTIQPTYLYMLSEPDLDNPTVIVNN